MCDLFKRVQELWGSESCFLLANCVSGWWHNLSWLLVFSFKTHRVGFRLRPLPVLNFSSYLKCHHILSVDTTNELHLNMRGRVEHIRGHCFVCLFAFCCSFYWYIFVYFKNKNIAKYISREMWVNYDKEEKNWDIRKKHHCYILG